MLLARYAFVLTYLVVERVLKTFIPEAFYTDNPMLWVSISLFAAFFGYRLISKKPFQSFIWVPLEKTKYFRTFERGLTRSFFGFLFASGGVGVSIALGFLKLEAPLFAEVQWVEFILGAPFNF